LGPGTQTPLPLCNFDAHHSQFRAPPKADLRNRLFQTPVKKGRHLGSQLLLDWYNGSQASEFIGDPSLHALILIVWLLCRLFIVRFW
jgi:hypothetical protein